MTTKYTNRTNLPLSIAVMLATDTYDHVLDPNYISATGLLKPLRSIAIIRSLPLDRQIDLNEIIAAKVGTAVHTMLEQAWLKNYAEALRALGYNDAFIDNIRINPFRDDYDTENLNIFMEIRTVKEVDGMKIGGKFDMVMDGKLRDLKTTSVWSYIKQSNARDYIEQGSIYRWLNPDIILDDMMSIDYIFTDWKAGDAAKNKDYPPSKSMEYNYPLMSLEDTELMLRDRIHRIRQLDNKPQHDLPLCTPLELWQDPSVWKYYTDPAKTNGRSTKNFTNIGEAYAFRDSKAKGIVLEVKPPAKRCNYCSAVTACLQAEHLISTGELQLTL